MHVTLDGPCKISIYNRAQGNLEKKEFYYKETTKQDAVVENNKIIFIPKNRPGAGGNIT